MKHKQTEIHAVLVDRIHKVNAEAKASHPSPRWDELHDTLDHLLEQITGR